MSFNATLPFSKPQQRLALSSRLFLRKMHNEEWLSRVTLPQQHWHIHAWWPIIRRIKMNICNFSSALIALSVVWKEQVESGCSQDLGFIPYGLSKWAPIYQGRRFWPLKLPDFNSITSSYFTLKTIWRRSRFRFDLCLFYSIFTKWASQNPIKKKYLSKSKGANNKIH